MTNPTRTANTNPVEGTTMTSPEITETDPATTVGTDATTDPVDAGEGAVDNPEAAALRAEAAKHRTKARAAEAERDKLAATVATFQRAEVEKLAASRLTAATDLWVGGVTLEGLLAEDGTVDAAKVSAAVATVLADHPHWAAPRKPAVPRDMGQGQRESALGPVRDPQTILRGA